MMTTSRMLEGGSNEWVSIIAQGGPPGCRACDASIARQRGPTGASLLAALLTRWIKLSLHVAFAAITATTLCLPGSAVGYALIAVVRKINARVAELEALSDQKVFLARN